MRKIIFALVLLFSPLMAFAQSYNRLEIFDKAIKEKTGLIVATNQELTTENIKYIAASYNIVAQDEVAMAFKLTDSLNLGCFFVDEIVGASEITRFSKIVIGTGRSFQEHPATILDNLPQINENVIFHQAGFLNDNSQWLLGLSEMSYPEILKSKNKFDQVTTNSVYTINNNLAFKIVESRSENDVGNPIILKPELEDLKLIIKAYDDEDPTVILKLKTDLGKALFEKVFLKKVSDPS